MIQKRPANAKYSLRKTPYAHTPKRNWLIYLFIFAAFSTIRGVAEFRDCLPAGWDSVNYYAPWTVSYIKNGVLNSHFLAAPPLIFFFTLPLTLLTQNVWLSIKILAPMLYGLLGVSLYYFSSSYLSWSEKKSLVCSLLLMTQIAALRISWDLFKNQLGISMLLFQLPIISKATRQHERKLALVIMALSLLIVLSHQFVAVAYFTILFSIFIHRTKSVDYKKYLLFANIPALILFITIFWVYSEGWRTPLVSSPEGGTAFFARAIHYVDAPTFSVFKNYISLYGSYENLLTRMVTVFILLYAPLLPLILFGFFNDDFLTPFLLLNLTGAFLPLISPTFALLDSERWLFMLVYPFSIYSVNALVKLASNSSLKFKFESSWFSRKKICVGIYLLLLIIFALGYAAGALEQIYKPIEEYVPTALSNKPVYAEAMQSIRFNVDWLNQIYLDLASIEMFDHFENLSSFWSYEGNFTVSSSVLRLDIVDGGSSYIFHNFNAEYFGVIEFKFKFDTFASNSFLLDVASIRRSSGYGGGVIYCYNSTLNYWDSESSASHELAPLDGDWHVIKITCDASGRRINIDGSDKLAIDTSGVFGEIWVGQTRGIAGYGGAFSIDYISIEGRASACLISSFREAGPVWMYLADEIDIIVFFRDLNKALNFAKNKPYTIIYLLLPTGPSDYVALVRQDQYYSIYAWRS